MADIFISYAREDAKWVAKLAAALERAGYSVWWDRNLVTGARYLKETEAQLRSAKATISVWSKTSIDSHWVADESAVARDLGRLAPISMDGTMPPLGFGQYQVTDFSGWRNGHDEPLQTLLRSLAERTGQTLEPVAPTAQPAKFSALGWAGGLAALLLVALAAAWTGGLFQSPGSAGSASVAVLPFADHSERSDQAHLTNGMTIELVTRLRGVGDLKVVGGDWMPAMVKETGGDPKALGQKLSVAYILDGDVRTERESLRITARLTKTDDSSIVWSEVYQREKSGIFAVQDDIASKAANALSVALDVGLQSTSYGGTRNFEAYDHYLRGRALRNAVRSEARYVHELEQAVALDPNYARAWSELALAFGTVMRQATTSEAMAAPLKQMDAASAKAEDLAPKMWFGHTPRAWYYLARNDLPAADAANQRALALGEVSDPEFYENMNNFEGQIGRISRSCQMTEKMLALDANRTIRRLAAINCALALRRDETVWNEYEASRAEQSIYSFLVQYYTLWHAMLEKRPDRARQVLKDMSPAGIVYTDLSLMVNSPNEAIAAMRKLATESGHTRLRYVTAAQIAGQLGEPELAVALLRKTYLGPGWAGYFAMWLPSLSETRKTQAFKDLMRELGFAEMWRKSGDWGDFCRPLAGDDFECT